MALRALPLVAAPNRMRLALVMAGATQTEVSDETGIARPSLSDIVNGKYGDLQIETARKLAAFFGCAIEDLFPAREGVV